MLDYGVVPTNLLTFKGSFTCIRDVENARRERREKMGFFPAFEADMLALAEGYGRMAKEGKDFLASLSPDSSD